MNRSANVTSIEAIRAMRGTLVNFETGARDALTGLVLEARRGMQWIETDQRRYWPAQAKKASEALIEARNELERCQLRVGSEEAPSCYEQKKKFEKAKRRLRYCEDQVRNVKRWVQLIRQEMKEFDGQIAQMTNCLDMDVPRAVAALGRMIDALEKYAEQYGVAGTVTTEAAKSSEPDTDAAENES